MKEIDYAGESFYVADAVADALLDYARELAGSTRADTVTITSYQRDGTRQQVDVLVGPASQIVSRTVDVDFEGAADDEHDSETVERIRKAARKLGPSRPVMEDPGETDLDML